MIIIPAIDLQGGQAVRLYKGDYAKKTVYSAHPEELAKAFEEMGAHYLHVVDLDGAKDAKATNADTIRKIRAAISIPMELGGGIRDDQTVNFYLNEVGVNRVILGTVALHHPEFVKACIDKYGSERIVVGVDIKNGFVSTSGWLEDSQVHYLDFIHELEKIGVKTIVCTDISKDGTLTGPTYEVYENIKKHSSIDFVVSGGVKDDEDLYKVNDLGYYGCIIGKAYYEGKVHLKEVIAHVG